MKKKLLILVSLFLILALSLGIAYGVMASSTDGEVGISLTIVGTTPPTPTPTEELGFTVYPDSLALGQVNQGVKKTYYVTLTRVGGTSPITVLVDWPTVPWGAVYTPHTGYLLSSTVTIPVYIDVNSNATPGTYSTSLLFHR